MYIIRPVRPPEIVHLNVILSSASQLEKPPAMLLKSPKQNWSRVDELSVT